MEQHCDKQPAGANEVRPLELALSFQMAIVMNMLVRSFAPYKERFRLSLTDWRIIFYLAMRPGSTAQEIANRGAIDKMTISSALQRLTRQKRVRAVPDLVDRRRRLLHLTDEGWNIYGALAPAVRQSQNDILAVLSDSEQHQFSVIIDRLATTLPVGPSEPAPLPGRPDDSKAV